MHPYGEVPFVRIVIPFVAGILLYALWQFHLPFWMLPIIIFLTLILQWRWQKSSSELFKKIHWLGWGLNVSLFLGGNQIAFYRADINHNNHFIHADKKFNYTILALLEPPVEKENSFKASVCVSYLTDQKELIPVCGKAIVYLEKDSLSRKLRYGDELITKNSFAEIAAPKNPDEFNYKRYLWYQGIYSSAFLKSDGWRPLHQRDANWLFEVSYWLRDHCRLAFQKYISPQREEAVMEALVVGYRDNMSMEVQQAYANTGVIHVLAVSGLHVGILYVVLDWLLFFMKRRKKWKAVQSLLIVLVIWLFAFVTGLSGSVVRAAMMFSLISIGKNWNLSSNPFNTLATSAILILLWNPLLIMDVGFQLSYAAVISIGAFFPYMNWWMPRETRIGDFLWKTTSMSLSAQLGTLPLTTFYFHQFPTLFLLANLIVIPMSSVLLIGGLILAFLQWIKPVAVVIGLLLEKFEWGMNEFIVCISGIPFSVIRLGTVTWLNAVVLLLIIIFITQYFIRRAHVYFFLGLSSLCVLAVMIMMQNLSNQKENQITVYAFPKTSLLEFRTGKQLVVYADSSFTNDPWHAKYLQQHDQWRGISDAEKIAWNHCDSNLNFSDRMCLSDSHNYFQFQNFKMVRVCNSLQKQAPGTKLKVDAILLSQNPKISLKQLLKFYDCSVIIVDGSNKAYREKKWEEEAESLHINCYEVMKRGAWTCDLPQSN